MSKGDRQLEHGQHSAGGVISPLCYLAHDIDDPANVGGFFRLADALGVEHIYLSGRTAVPPNTKLKRLSRSAEKYVPYSYRAEVEHLLAELKQQGYRLVCLEITRKSKPLHTFKAKPGDKVCLILGSENTGVAQSLLDACDEVYHIPMQGNNSSMNVAQACAIASYQMCLALAN